MECYCKDQAEITSKDEARTLEFDVNNGEMVKVCDYYFSDVIMSKLLGNSITLIIIIVNEVLKRSIIKLIQWIGEDTVSEQLSSITNGVFYAQFFNTGILLLIVNANITEHEPRIIT